MKLLTPLQKEVYDYIMQYREANGKPPTIRETETALGKRISPDTIGGIVAKGYLHKVPRKHRGLGI